MAWHHNKWLLTTWYFLLVPSIVPNGADTISLILLQLDLRAYLILYYVRKPHPAGYLCFHFRSNEHLHPRIAQSVMTSLKEMHLQQIVYRALTGLTSNIVATFTWVESRPIDTVELRQLWAMLWCSLLIFNTAYQCNNIMSGFNYNVVLLSCRDCHNVCCIITNAISFAHASRDKMIAISQ